MSLYLEHNCEDELIELAKENDLGAFEALFKAYYDRIYNYLYFKVGNKEAAEDLAQQTFLAAFEGLKNFRQRGGTFSSWIFRIAHNKCMSYFRKNYSSKESPGELENMNISSGTTPEEDTIRHESQEDLRKALLKLKKEQRKVLELRFFASLSVEETAKVMKRSAGAVKVLQYRAVKNLENVLKNEF